jgi:hypothetical protein
VALVEVDVVSAQAAEGVVDLLEDLLPRQPFVVTRVVHRKEQLRGEHVRVARTAREHVAEEGLRSAAAVDVRGVDEVDADLECLLDAGAGGGVVDAETVGQPATEGDLGDLKVAGAESPIAHEPIRTATA